MVCYFDMERRNLHFHFQHGNTCTNVESHAPVNSSFHLYATRSQTKWSGDANVPSESVCRTVSTRLRGKTKLKKDKTMRKTEILKGQESHYLSLISQRTANGQSSTNCVERAEGNAGTYIEYKLHEATSRYCSGGEYCSELVFLVNLRVFCKTKTR